jgi:hypothetical protein
MRMPFGKYYGEDVRSIPHDYLRWILENVVLRTHGLEEEIRAVLSGEDSPGSSPDRDDGHWWATIRLCLRFHPDRGGDPSAMIAINAFMDELEKEIGD